MIRLLQISPGRYMHIKYKNLTKVNPLRYRKGEVRTLWTPTEGTAQSTQLSKRLRLSPLGRARVEDTQYLFTTMLSCGHPTTCNLYRVPEVAVHFIPIGCYPVHHLWYVWNDLNVAFPKTKVELKISSPKMYSSLRFQSGMIIIIFKCLIINVTASRIYVIWQPISAYKSHLTLHRWWFVLIPPGRKSILANIYISLMDWTRRDVSSLP